ncbi:MAG: hypothetical protein K0M63_06265 [Weeksellaceae bacterium]|nr:hypothetical protein [Weeksellaceae bacterium]
MIEFNHKYKKERYHKYPEKITFDKNCYSFETQVICGDESAEVKEILQNGILNPHIYKIYHTKKFFSDNKHLNKKQYRNDLNFLEKDTIGISNLVELTYLNINHKRKRFRFWSYEKPFASPLLYFLELTNKNARKDTKLTDFIKGAKLTYIQQAWFE